jgi:hypothetical protein
MSRVTQDDVLFGYRCQVFDLAGRTSVSHACRTFGIHRSTYYAWKAQVDRGGPSCCARESAGARECPTSSQASSRNPDFPGPAASLGWPARRDAAGGPQPRVSDHERSGCIDCDEVAR